MQTTINEPAIERKPRVLALIELLDDNAVRILPVGNSEKEVAIAIEALRSLAEVKAAQ